MRLGGLRVFSARFSRLGAPPRVFSVSGDWALALASYAVNPKEKLAPVPPNCPAFLHGHHRSPSMSRKKKYFAISGGWEAHTLLDMHLTPRTQQFTKVARSWVTSTDRRPHPRSPGHPRETGVCPAPAAGADSDAGQRGSAAPDGTGTRHATFQAGRVQVRP
jgi:hypothetical protein